VPGSWPGGAPGAAPAASSTTTPWISDIVERETGPANLVGGMPLAAGGGAHGSGPRYGFRPKIMVHPPSAG
jgi:hypothetical protein